MNAASRALRIASKRIRKLLGRSDDPEIVRLRSSAPTVSREATARLEAKRGISRQTTTVGSFVAEPGPMWFKFTDDGFAVEIESQPDTFVKPVDFDELPGA